MKKEIDLEKESKCLAHEITTFQLKAARYSLNFRVQDVTRMTGVAASTILRMEAKDPFSYPKRTSLQCVVKLIKLYEAYGAIFYKNGSLKLEKTDGNFKDDLSPFIQWEENVSVVPPPASEEEEITKKIFDSLYQDPFKKSPSQ
jgi:hypothetical protein